MMRTLILFTEGFPLKGITEGAFIRPELVFLAQGFERVFLVPAHADEKIQNAEEFPENVFVDFRYFKMRNKPVTMRECIRRPISACKAIFGNHAFGLMKADLHSRVLAARFEAWLAGFMASNGLSPKDVILYSFWLTLEAEFIGNWRKRHLNVLVIARAHRFDIFDIWQTNFRRQSLKGLWGIYPCSEDGSRTLRKQYPMLEGRIKTAYLGVPAAALPNPTPQGEGKLTFFSCHNLIERKRGVLCAQSLIALARRLPERTIRWILVGDGPEREVICSLVKEAPVNFELDWRGALPNAEVRKIYATEPIDFAVLLSSSEGLAVMEQEALSYGIPVISADVGGARECINKETGLLLPADVTPENFAAAVLPIIEFRKEMRSAAVKMYESKFNSQNNRSAFVRAICEECFIGR